MKKPSQGFTLIEFITVIILVGILSVVLFSRIDSSATAAVQSGRDDLIAAFSFAQQTAMMRPNITLVISGNSISVNENGTPILAHYPLTMPAGVSLSPAASYNFDKLGRTTVGTINIIGSGVSATVIIESSGYAHAN